ncbi:toxin Cry1Ac domain D-VI-related protein [Listeria rocourtiae]|uniref:toxin Cry1Ac domain D-VI-related protein n=1 Tax=Listeria rocourtiae TaxID=647910 RepID=UPI003D2F96A1
MQKKQIPFNVVPTKKVKKIFFSTIATVTVLSQMLTVYPAISFAAEIDSEATTATVATEVGDFATLKQLIETDNGITNIILTADITMTSAIQINSKKTELTIDGNGHSLTESKTTVNGQAQTIYTYTGASLKTLNVKNMVIRGTHYYGPFTVYDGVQGVTQNFENVDYAGPQFVYNLHGYVNFTGTNKIVTSKPIDNLGTLNEMVEATGVTIAGDFTAEHNTTGKTAFSLYSAVGTVGDPYFIIKDGAKVNIDSKGSSVFWATADKADFTVGKNAQLNVTTSDELFQAAMENVLFDTNSTTLINRIGVSSAALMPVSRTFTVNQNASLKAIQPATSTSHVITTTLADAAITFNNPRDLDLDANGTGSGRVFSTAKNTMIKFNNLDEIAVYGQTNKTSIPDKAWYNATFSVLASGQAGVVQAGAVSTPGDIQTTFIMADAKHISMTGTVIVAEKTVKELFKNDDPATDEIKDTTTQASIDAAQKLVDGVTDPTSKAALQKDVNRAQELLDARNAASAEKARQEAALKAVNELFNSDKPSTDAIKDITNQAAIDAAQKLVDAVTDEAVKAQLQKDLDRAQELLDARNAAASSEQERQEAALKAVNELFNIDKPSTDAIKDITNQGAIDAAQKLVDAVTDPIVKAALQKDLDRAQELLNERNAAEKARQEAALKAVNELFNSDKPSTDAIKDITNQAAIDAAQKLVDAVTDEAVKAQLQKDLDRAQELLDARNAANAAEKAVNELFNNNTPTSPIKDTTNQGAIDNAQKAIDKVTDPVKKAELQKNLDKAQQELNDRNNFVLVKPILNPMTEADTVFSGKLDVSKYNPGTIRIYINNAPATVVAVDSNGNFSYNIGHRKAGDVIGVDYKDRTGQYNADTNTSITVTPVSSNISINKMTENDDTITGKTTPNAKIRFVINGQAVNIGYADANGNYALYVGKQKTGTVVGAELFNVSSNEYKEAVTTTVIAVNVTITPMTNANDTVTGTAPANAKLRFLINGVAVNVGTADAQGNYSKYIGTQLVGTKVAVEMLNPETGKYELAKETTVTGAPKSTEYTVNAMTTSDDTLSGTAPAGGKLRFSINGQLISIITADASGKYSKFIGNQKQGTVISVELLNENTNQYTPAKEITVSAPADMSALAPVINTIVEGTGVVSGTVPQNVTTVRTWVNGVTQVMVPATNGTFTWTKANLKAGDVVKVDYKDATGNWISSEKVVTK